MGELPFINYPGKSLDVHLDTTLTVQEKTIHLAGVNFTNILRAAICTKVSRKTSLYLDFRFVLF
jgi:hypothetical protein